MQNVVKFSGGLVPVSFRMGLLHSFSEQVATSEILNSSTLEAIQVRPHLSSCADMLISITPFYVQVRFPRMNRLLSAVKYLGLCCDHYFTAFHLGSYGVNQAV